MCSEENEENEETMTNVDYRTQMTEEIHLL